MKKFKKISAVLGTFALAGLTLGAMPVASGANFPAPFVDNGVADVAIVHGTGAGVSSLDQVYAGNIQSELAEEMPSSGTVIDVEGDSFKLDRSSVKFHYGDELSEMYPTLDGDELEFLAEGEYKEDDVDAEYEQDIKLSDKTLEIFSERDYEDEEATVGFHWENTQNVLNYTLKFTEDLNISEMEDTKLPFLGREYYVLSTDTAGKIELLDTADSAVLDLGESVTLAEKEVSVNFISDNEVKFTVDGETTPLLEGAESYELSDGSYIVATEILASAKDSVTNSVEFSIGSGKLVLENEQEVEWNEDDIDELEAEVSISGDDNLDSITLVWNADDDLFLTEDNSLVMPGFEAVGLVYGGMNYPSSSEVVSITSGEQLKLNMDNYVLDLMWVNDSDGSVNLGSEYQTLNLANDSYTFDDAGFAGTGSPAELTAGDVWWDSDNESDADTTFAEDALNLSVDSRFIVTVIDDDLGESRTLYYEVTEIDVDVDAEEFTIELDDLIGNNDLTIDQDDDDWTIEEEDIELTVEGFNADNNVTYISFNDILDYDAGITYDKVVSDKGLVVTLPTDVSTFDSGADLTFKEADYRGDINKVDAFDVTVDYADSEDEDALHVESVENVIKMVEESDDVKVGYVKSALASRVLLDESSDEHEFEIEYFGEEASADVFVTSADAESVSEGSSALGDVLVKDTEVNAVQAKNLIIVGGSCINSAAAEVLGVPERTCGDAFTAATGVGSGQFLIESVADAYTEGKIALVVAGYDVTGTNNAATYLRTQDVDTSAGMKYVGTSATEATLQVE